MCIYEIYIHICTYIYTHQPRYTCVYLNMLTNVVGDIYAWMQTHKPTFMYIDIDALNIHTYKQKNIPNYIHTYTYIQTHTQTNIHRVCRHLHTCMHVHLHIIAGLHLHLSLSLYIYIYLYIHNVHTRVFAYTYEHTFIKMYVCT